MIWISLLFSLWVLFDVDVDDDDDDDFMVCIVCNEFFSKANCRR